jgi:hypothetical protein
METIATPPDASTTQKPARPPIANTYLEAVERKGNDNLDQGCQIFLGV